MKRNTKDAGKSSHSNATSDYKDQLYHLQVQLVKLQNQMFARTHTTFAPWTIVRTDDKHEARVNVIKDLLAGIDYKGKDDSVLLANPDVVFNYAEECLKVLAP